MLEVATAALAWLAAARRLPELRRHPEDPVIRLWFLNLCLLAAALSMRLTPVYLGIDRLTGASNVSSLIGQVLGLSAAWSLRDFYLLVLDAERATPRQRVRGWLLAGAVAVVMTVLFFRVGGGSRPSDSVLSDHPDLLGNWLLFLTCCAYVLLDLVRLWWRGAASSHGPLLGTGLRTMAVGGVVGLLWAAHQFGNLVTLALGRPHPLLESDLLSNVLFGSMLTLVVVGSTMPGWVRRFGLRRLLVWQGRYRAHQELYPLWQALYEAQPKIALAHPHSRLADRLAVRDLRFRLYRRVIEIRDGLLAMEPWRHPAVLDDVPRLGPSLQLPEEQSVVEAEAAALAAAIEARAAGEPPKTTASSFIFGSATPETEVAVLLRLAEAWNRSTTCRGSAMTSRRQRVLEGHGQRRHAS